MAFQKTFIKHGVPCNYVKIGYVAPNYVTREITVHFALYYSAEAAAADPKAPLVPILAKLRLKAAKFEQWLSAEAIAANSAEDPFRGQLYAAAKAEPIDCDFRPAEGQATVFSDALDV
jgi:hypothetical protein